MIDRLQGSGQNESDPTMPTRQIDLFFRMIQKAAMTRKKSTIGQYSARIYGKAKHIIAVERQIV
jgi:hypothetical protein